MKKWIINNFIVCRYCFHLSPLYTTYCYHCNKDIDRQFSRTSAEEAEKVYSKSKFRLLNIIHCQCQNPFRWSCKN